jgi:hypothetical protein
MPLPANASLQAASSLLRNLHAIHTFLREQDDITADARYEALRAQLTQAREHLRWNPASGRPARFLQARSMQGRALAARAQALAAAQGVPELRELILRPYVLLYAHNASRVVLLALKHERQLEFQLA